MKYEGELYGKMAGKYIPLTATTQNWKDMENKIIASGAMELELRGQIKDLQFSVNEHVKANQSLTAGYVKEFSDKDLAIKWLARNLQEIDSDANGGFYQTYTAEEWIERAMTESKES